MSEKFPSIWLEVKQSYSKNVLVCGLYREWSSDGLLNMEDQLNTIKILTSQIEAADLEKKNIVVLGDVNICTNNTDTENQNMKSIQVAQNKMMRMLDGISLKEHVTSSSLLKKYNLPSVNQLAGEIKLMEAWKSTHVPSYPFQMRENNPNRPLVDREVRLNTNKKWKDYAKTKAASVSMSIDCARLWNLAPSVVTNAETKFTAKREIKKFSRSLEL